MSFQSSPVPKDGCNKLQELHGEFVDVFQSSPVPKDGCNGSPNCWTYLPLLFQSSPVPKDGCNLLDTLVAKVAGKAVSILTRPEGRVQPVWAALIRATAQCFNPHPSRRTGATWSISAASKISDCLFQSSPVPKDGCNRHRHRPAASGGQGFNPHPSRRTGATRPASCHKSAMLEFQSSPVPKDGCNRTMLTRQQVSILFQSSPVPKDGCNLAHLRGRHIG